MLFNCTVMGLFHPPTLWKLTERPILREVPVVRAAIWEWI
jgi:hypothetical protein